MSKEKTISDLNEKSWYRFLKVIFIVSLLLILGVFNLFAFFGEDIKQLDLNQTTIQCNLGITKEVFTAQGLGLKLWNSDFPNEQFNYKTFNEGNNNLAIWTVLKECYPTAQMGTYNYDYSQDQYLRNQYLSSGADEFTIKPVFTYESFLEIFIYGNIIILIIFEAIRRAFYYIFLGRFKPEE